MTTFCIAFYESYLSMLHRASHGLNGINFPAESIPADETELEFLKKSMGARNQEGIGLSYRPARPDRLAEFIPWNRFLGSITFKKGQSIPMNVIRYGLCP